LTLYWGSFDTLSMLQLARSMASEKTNKLHIEICEKMKASWHKPSERICTLVRYVSSSSYDMHVSSSIHC